MPIMASDVFAHEMLDEQQIPELLLNHSSMSGMETGEGEYDMDNNDMNANVVVMRDMGPPEPTWKANMTLVRGHNPGDSEMPPEWGLDYSNPEFIVESVEGGYEDQMRDIYPEYSPELMVQRFNSGELRDQFIQKINEGVAERWRHVEEQRRQEEEEAATKQRIAELRRQKEEVELNNAKLEKKGNKRIAESEKEIQEAKSALHKTNKALKKAKDNKIDFQKLKEANQYAKDASKQRKQIEEWEKTHGIKFVAPQIDNSGDGAMIGDAEVILIVTAVIPDSPDKKFKIRLQQRTVSKEGGEPSPLVFEVLSVFPLFEEAFEVLNAANDSQDFITFLVECKARWRQEHENKSPESNGYARGEQTAPLFDTETSTLSNDST